MTVSTATHAQVARQKRRERSGQYQANPCYLCGRGAPIDDYQSHGSTDRDDPLGEHFGDYALVLCDGCGNAAGSLPHLIQVQVFAHAVNRGIRRDRAENLALALPLPAEDDEDPRGEGAVVAELVRATVALDGAITRLWSATYRSAEALAPSAVQGRLARLEAKRTELRACRERLIERHVTEMQHSGRGL